MSTRGKTDGRNEIYEILRQHFDLLSHDQGIVIQNYLKICLLNIFSPCRYQFPYSFKEIYLRHLFSSAMHIMTHGADPIHVPNQS